MKRRSQLHLFASAICLLVLLAFSGCRPSHEREISSRVLTFEGQVQCSVGGQTSRLSGHSFLPPGAKVSSGPNARVDLMLLPGVLMELAGDTEIEILRLRLERDGDESIRPMIAREAEVRLLRGSITASVGLAETDSQLLVHTAFGIIDTGQEMTCRVGVRADSERVLCVRGQVILLPSGAKEEMAIPNGHFADLPAEGATPGSIADAGAQVQAEVPAVLEVEQRLHRLFEENGSNFKPW